MHLVGGFEYESCWVKEYKIFCLFSLIDIGNSFEWPVSQIVQ